MLFPCPPTLLELFSAIYHEVFGSKEHNRLLFVSAVTPEPFTISVCTIHMNTIGIPKMHPMDDILHVSRCNTISARTIEQGQHVKMCQDTFCLKPFVKVCIK